MKKYLFIIFLLGVLYLLTGCPSIDSNIRETELSGDESVKYSHTWKSGKRYIEFANPEKNGMVLFFTYEINNTTKDNFDQTTINNIYEVSGLVAEAQRKFENQGIDFKYIDSLKNAKLLTTFQVKDPPVVIILDRDGTQVHRFNPAARSMIKSSFSRDFDIYSAPSDEQQDTVMTDTINRTMGVEMDNILTFLIKKNQNKE